MTRAFSYDAENRQVTASINGTVSARRQLQGPGRELNSGWDLEKPWSGSRFPQGVRHRTPLSFSGQEVPIVPLRVWFKWMARHHYILHNPASELEVPRLGVRLPKAVLSASEVEQIMLHANIHDPLGLRDRAIVETLYSTGMRRLEPPLHVPAPAT